MTDQQITSSKEAEIELFSLAGNDGNLREVSPSFAQLLGITVEEISGKSLLELVHPEDIGNIVAGIAELEDGASEVLMESRFRQSDGRYVYLQWIARPLPNSNLWWASGRDTTEFHRLVNETADLKARLDLALSHATAAMWEIDHMSKALTLESVASQIIGVDVSALPKSIASLLSLFGESEAEAIAKAFENLATQSTMEISSFFGDGPQRRYVSLRGKVISFDRRNRPLRSVGLIVDVTAEKALEEQMLKMIMSDGLTGVPNRRAFDQGIRSQWRLSKRDSTPLTLVMIDIDNFKKFNDTFGHLVGDDALCAIARALGSQVNGQDEMVARFGGEEFSIILPNTNGDSALERCERILETVRKVQVRQAPDWNFSVSMGAATALDFPKELKATDLLASADRCLYAAKESGKDRVVAKVVDTEVSPG
ncbi:MAG: GGDEF domain-containing protein [Actinomycetota bacterium]|nr:GGDEF domain-containing protein [Actinomycetota bacterium]